MTQCQDVLPQLLWSSHTLSTAPNQLVSPGHFPAVGMLPAGLRGSRILVTVVALNPTVVIKGTWSKICIQLEFY